MPRLELEIDDKGDFVGTTPPEIEAILKRVEAEHYKVGYGKGVEQAARDAQRQIDDTVKHELAKRDALAPLEKERYSRIESENESLTAQLAERAREWDRTLKGREEVHARELIARTEALKQRDERIKQLTRSSIRMEALQSGARDESLDELEVILDHYVGYDDDMNPFVKQSDGSPQLQHGKRLPLSAFVKQYLDNHPHHRRPAQGRGGDARGGASLRTGGNHASAQSTDAVKERINSGDRSTDAVADLFNATRAARGAA